VLDVALAVFHGNKEEAKEALKDPAVRRGMALVLEGLARYGVTVPQKLPAPFLVVWNFTNMCNLRCKHCYQRADKPLPDELTLEEKLDVVKQLDEAGVAAVALSGGEPTIHPHFYKVVRSLADRGIYVAVATNGWLFADKKYLIKAKEMGVRYIEVSVDSADPSKHDEFRGVPGSWKKAIQTLRNAVEVDLNHAMAVTVTKNNLDEIDDIIITPKTADYEEKLLNELEGQRDFEKNTWMYWLVAVVAFSWSVFQLAVVVHPINGVYVRAAHLAFGVFLAFTMYPILKKTHLRKVITWYDLTLALVGVVVSLYQWYAYNFF